MGVCWSCRASVITLSERERQTMDLLIEQDKLDCDLAPLLGVTPRAVTHRIWRVCNKLGVDTRVRAAILYDRERR